jgi:ATP-dependent DNA helicase RecG
VKNVDKSSVKIIGLIHGNNKITALEMASLLGITKRAVEKQLASLQNRKLVVRVGPDKGGHWIISEK